MITIKNVSMIDFLNYNEDFINFYCFPFDIALMTKKDNEFLENYFKILSEFPGAVKRVKNLIKNQFDEYSLITYGSNITNQIIRCKENLYVVNFIFDSYDAKHSINRKMSKNILDFIQTLDYFDANSVCLTLSNIVPDKEGVKFKEYFIDFIDDKYILVNYN